MMLLSTLAITMVLFAGIVALDVITTRMEFAMEHLMHACIS